MIGVVLAAGASRRLRPETDALPKTLLPVVGETTILDITLRNFATVGLTDAVIVVGYAARAVADRVADLEARSGLRIELVHNARAEEWNNAYSLWLAREHFMAGAILANGDTVHPGSVEKTLLAAGGAGGAGSAGEAGSSRGAGGGGAGSSRWAGGAGGAGGGGAELGRIVIAIDDVKPLGAEEMKVVLGPGGRLRQITKVMEPDLADGEYMGVTLIEPSAAIGLADALEATWRRDPGRYYEDGFAEFSDRGGEVFAAPIGAVDWVEVDNHADLRLAREIAARC